MAGSSSSNPSSGPKILLAKPGLVSGGAVGGKFGRGEDETVPHVHPHPLRSRLPSLNLLSDSWDFHIDRFLPFLSENTEFTVVGVIGVPGVGKSTIMNELYGFDATSPGMLPPFPTLSEDTRAQAKHCTSGIEPRISAQRLLLLDTQPVFSSSVLAEIMRPDGSSTIPVLSGESLSAELALELMSIQVDLLKHGIPDPSSLTASNSQSSNLGSEKDKKDKANEGEEYMATPVFVHAKLQDQNCTPHTYEQLRKALAQYFSASSFVREKCGNVTKEPVEPGTQSSDALSTVPKLFLIPSKSRDDSPNAQYESYSSALWKLRDEVLSMNCPSFARTVSERDWLKNSAKIWELIKSSPIISEYSRMLQSSAPEESSVVEID
ncbi:SMG9-like protein [Citrus sinensis]|uniref:SMG9-like protein n=1 Tax=Citrus sinensis TaxID=2711 RepID=A0ACB8MFN9_CITSI|nr:SMG9-like protein [Citrus sinensis]